MLIAHVTRFSEYKGMDAGFYAGNFKWPAKNEWAGEMFNFKASGGRYYGYVEAPNVRIERLGASRKADRMDGVLVVWTSPDPDRPGRTIVGWYRNATVYRRRQEAGSLASERRYRGRVIGYQFEARTEDCTLLEPERRVLTIPPRSRTQKGLPGQNPIYYPADHNQTAARTVEERIREFIDTGRIAPSAKPPPRKGYQVDVKRRRAIEDAAIDFVWQYFKRRGYELEDRQGDDCGYDLTATSGDVVLCIEVKGRSGLDVSADFTINEYDHIKLHQNRKFADGVYRVAAR